MPNDTKLLSFAEKKVAAKTMYRMGWSSREVEKWLNISDTTVLKASTEATPEELKEFENHFQAVLKDMKQKGLAMSVKRMLELIPDYKRLDHLVKASEYFEGKETPIANVNLFTNPTFIKQYERS